MCDVGSKIHHRRTELGLTLEEVGRAVGVDKSTVQRWERGMIRNMGNDKIAALAKVLQLDPVELVPGNQDEGKTPHRSVYADDEDMERLESLHQDPRLGLLFDHSRKMSKEDVDLMIYLAERILRERNANE